MDGEDRRETLNQQIELVPAIEQAKYSTSCAEYSQEPQDVNAFKYAVLQNASALPIPWNRSGAGRRPALRGENACEQELLLEQLRLLLVRVLFLHTARSAVPDRRL